MWVHHLHKLLALEVLDFHDAIRVARNNTQFRSVRVTLRVLWTTGPHQSLYLVKVAQTGSKKLGIAFEVLECNLFGETVFDDVRQS